MKKRKEEQVKETSVSSSEPELSSSEVEEARERKSPSISKDMIKINYITPETKKSLKVRTITALLLAALVIPLVILGDWFFVIGLCIFSLIAIYEFINVLSSKKFPLIVDIFTFIMTFSFIFWIGIKQYVQDPTSLYQNGHFYMSDIQISTLGVASLVLVLFLFALSYSRFDVTDVCYLTTMSILVSLCIQAIYFIRLCPSSVVGLNYEYSNHLATCLLFFYVALGAFFSDIGAYFFGILFGKHKMNPRISPKKTWEGFVGGIVVSFIVTFSFAMICDACNTPILNGILDKAHWWWIVIISLSMPPVSVLGDLLFSTIKRYYKIKDFGNLLPGHGGVLDRIDSLLITCLFVSCMILIIRYFPFWSIS